VFDLLDIAHDRHWNVVIQPSAVHLLPI